MSRPRLFRWCLMALPAALMAAPCFAQSSGLFGSRGPQSSTSAGGVRSSQGNYTGFGQSQLNGFGSTPGMGAGGFGQSGSGQQGLGGMSFGQTGTGTGGAGRTSALNGGLNGSGRTSNLGQNGAGGTGQFGQRNALGQGGQLGRNGLGGRNGQRGGRNGQSLNAQNNPADEQMPVRIRPQVNFQFPSRPAATVNTSIQTRFDHISERGPALRNVHFDLEDGGQVVLRGQVPNEDSKRLAAALVRLEPGVRGVTNELTVEAATATGR